MKKTLCLILASMLGASAFGSMLMQIISTHNGPAVVIDGVTYYLPAYAVTEPTTNYPAGFEPFGVNFDGESDVGALEISAWIQSGIVGDIIPIAAYGITTNDSFIALDRSGTNGVVLEVTDAGLGTTVELPYDGFQLLWPVNTHGVGNPIAINRTEITWIGFPTTFPGKEFFIVGRNLDLGDHLCKLYIDGYGWVNNTSSNPYRADFIIPSDLPTGTYTIYAHNGHGGKYGWSKPFEITVTDYVVWSGNTYNVKTYGAVGDGVTDDTAAILSAFTDANANNMSTLYFPAGKYALGRSFNGGDNMRILGDGPELSVITTHSSIATATYKEGFFHQWVGATEFVDIGFDLNNYSTNFTRSPIMTTSTSTTWLRVDNIAISTTNMSSWTTPMIFECSLSGTTLPPFIEIAYSKFYGGTLNVGSSYANIKNCDFYGMWDRDYLISTGGNSSITGCTAQHWNSGLEDKKGWCQGRVIFNMGLYSKYQHIYIADNNFTNMMPRNVGVSPPQQNTGEFIMFEFCGTRSENHVASTPSSTNVVFIENLAVSNYYTTIKYPSLLAVIVDGKGMGQIRNIYSSTTNSITVTEPWEVMPDTTSVIQCGTYAHDIVAYNNLLDGMTTTNVSATCGFNAYGSLYNSVIASNQISDVHSGVILWSLIYDDPFDSPYPAYSASTMFNLVEGNTAVDIKTPYAQLYSVGTYTGQTASTNLVAYGNVFRRNADMNSVNASYRSLVDGDGVSGDMKLTAIQDNISSNGAFFLSATLDGGITTNYMVQSGNSFHSRYPSSTPTKIYVDFGGNTYFDTGIVSGPGIDVVMSAKVNSYTPNAYLFGTLTGNGYGIKMENLLGEDSFATRLGSSYVIKDFDTDWNVFNNSGYYREATINGSGYSSVSWNIGAGSINVGKASGATSGSDMLMEWVQVYSNTVLIAEYRAEDITDMDTIPDRVGDHTATLYNASVWEVYPTILVAEINGPTNVYSDASVDFTLQAISANGYTNNVEELASWSITSTNATVTGGLVHVNPDVEETVVDLVATYRGYSTTNSITIGGQLPVVKFNGTSSYFNTGLASFPNMRIDVRLRFPDTDTGWNNNDHITGNQLGASWGIVVLTNNPPGSVAAKANANNYGITPITTNEWIYISYQPSVSKFIVNTTTNSTSANYSKDTAIDVGRSSWGGAYGYAKFDLDYFRVYTNGVLIRDYRAEDAVGTTITDRVGSHTATLIDCVIE